MRKRKLTEAQRKIHRARANRKYYNNRKKYNQYVDKLSKLNKVTGKNKMPLTYKEFMDQLSLMKAKDIPGKTSKAIEIAKEQVYSQTYQTAKAVRQAYKDAELDDIPSIGDIMGGKVSTRDIAAALDLGSEYHDLLSQGMSSKDASHYISQYYFGSE